MKKFIATLLVLAMTFCMSSISVFAEETKENTIPENATRHTIELTLQPEDIYNADVISAENSGVAPCIWGDPSITMIDNHVAYTSSFYVSDRYFAFEMEGFLDDGITTNEGYVVAFQHISGGTVASMSGNPDGSVYKVDWITINVDGNYRFQITNGTDYVLTVYITYYSWN